MFKQLLTLVIFSLISFPAIAQVSQHKLEHDEIIRDYHLFIPDGYDSDEIGHLIMVLHGGGMTTMDMMQHTRQQFNKLIDEHQLNAIIVYPQGVGRGWNDGRIREGQIAYVKGIDDVDFLLYLADTLADDYNIEADGLFLTGFSNGAGMSYRVACKQPEQVAAIAPVSNMIASTFDCDPESPVAVLSIVGDEDPILPLSGGDLYYWDIPLGSVLSLEDTLAIWHLANQCDDYEARINLPDIAPEDKTTASIQHATNCEQPLSSLIIHGGGHTWAGSPLYVSIEEYGLTSHDIDAGEFIFDFFVGVGLGNHTK